MEGDAVDLGHAGSGGVRADGLQNVLIGMGTGRDKSQYTKTTATVFLPQEELENLYGEWLPRRIVDIYADQATRKGFKVLFGGEGVFYALLKGPGKVWIQTLPISRLAGRILSYGKGNRKEEGSILGGLGNLIDGD
jgi:hypothetical protein